jgi:hypothetical protein
VNRLAPLAAAILSLGISGVLSPTARAQAPAEPKRSDPLPAPPAAPAPATLLEKETPVDVGPLRLLFAAGWVKQTPTSKMRAAQAELPAPAKEGGAAELTVFFFGKGQGGDAAANVARWKAQIERPEGLSDEEFSRESRREAAGLPVTVLEMRGRYLGSRFPGQPEPTPIDDARLTGVIIEHPDGNWFIKIAGPRATMDHHRAAIEAMIAGIEKSAAKPEEAGKPAAPKPLPPGHP